MIPSARNSLTPTATDKANKVWKGAGVGALIGGAAGLVVTTLLMPEVGAAPARTIPAS